MSILDERAGKAAQEFDEYDLRAQAKFHPSQSSTTKHAFADQKRRFIF